MGNKKCTSSCENYTLQQRPLTLLSHQKTPGPFGSDSGSQSQKYSCASFDETGEITLDGTCEDEPSRARCEVRGEPADVKIELSENLEVVCGELRSWCTGFSVAEPLVYVDKRRVQIREYWSECREDLCERKRETLDEMERNVLLQRKM